MQIMRGLPWQKNILSLKKKKECWFSLCLSKHLSKHKEAPEEARLLSEVLLPLQKNEITACPLGQDPQNGRLFVMRSQNAWLISTLLDLKCQGDSTLPSEVDRVLSRSCQLFCLSWYCTLLLWSRVLWQLFMLLVNTIISKYMQFFLFLFLKYIYVCACEFLWPILENFIKNVMKLSDTVTHTKLLVEFPLIQKLWMFWVPNYAFQLGHFWKFQLFFCHRWLAII